VTLVLAGATVVTSLDPPVVRPGDVTIDNGRVHGVGSTGAPTDAVWIDCSGCLVFPGNVCVHHHLYSSLARGMPYDLEAPETFVQVLQRVWWRLDRALDPASIAMSAWSGGADALLAGTTTIVDHHASPNAIDGSLERVDAELQALGVRRILCYEVTDRDGSERAAAGLEETRGRLKRVMADASEAPLSRAMVGAHASFTLSDETLGRCVELADEFDIGIHVHVAEDAADQRDSQARFGRRVVERLAGAGALTERSLLAHCVDVDERERDLIRDARAWVAHNPRSNMNNRVGRAPVEELGGRVALGTDGIDGDMFAECRAAYLRGREADARTTPDAVLARLAASARFAGTVFGEPLLGRIEPGAPADVVVLDYDPPTPLVAENLGGHWMFGLSARDVRDVVVGGDVVVRDRAPTGLSARRLSARRVETREVAAAMWQRMATIGPHPFEPAGSA
jgi:putative selenium metabolism protein SsnA